MRTMWVLLILGSLTIGIGAVPMKIEKIEDSEIPSFLAQNEKYNIGFVGKNVSDNFIESLLVNIGGLLKVKRLETDSKFGSENGFVVYPIGDTHLRDEYHQEWNESNFTINQLIQFLDPLVKGSIEKISGANFDKWIKTKLSFGNKILITIFENNPQKKHLAYRSLSEIDKYSAKFHFTFCNEETDVIKGMLKIEKFPTLMGFTLVQGNKGDGSKSISAFPFNGPINYLAMAKWLDQLIHQTEPLTFPKDSENNNESQVEEEVPQFSEEITIMNASNQANLLDGCDNTQCILAFDNFWLDDKSRFEKTVDILKKVQKNFNPQGLRVFLIDAGCQEDLLPSLNFQLEFTPNLILYNAEAREYYPLMGKFDSVEIMVFIKKVKGKIYKPIKLPEKIKLPNRDCAQEKERWLARKKGNIARTPEEEELMKEVMEEIKRKEAENKFTKSAKKSRRSEEL